RSDDRDQVRLHLAGADGARSAGPSLHRHSRAPGGQPGGGPPGDQRCRIGRDIARRGNWVPEDFQGAIKRPVPPTDLAQAKKLMAEAGAADGFEISTITPLPPYFSWGERVATQLRQINIKTGVNTMERGAVYEKLAPGRTRL